MISFFCVTHNISFKVAHYEEIDLAEIAADTSGAEFDELSKPNVAQVAVLRRIDGSFGTHRNLVIITDATERAEDLLSAICIFISIRIISIRVCDSVCMYYKS